LFLQYYIIRKLSAFAT